MLFCGDKRSFGRGRHGLEAGTLFIIVRGDSEKLIVLADGASHMCYAPQKCRRVGGTSSNDAATTGLQEALLA